MRKNEYITVFDVGSSKIICLIAKIIEEKPKIIGVGHCRSDGVNAGNITDVARAKECILNALTQAERMAMHFYNCKDIEVDSAYIILSSRFLQSDIMHLAGPVISNSVVKQDIINLIKQIYLEYEDKGSGIIHCLPIKYKVDEQGDIKNPIGIYGKNLECFVNVVSIQESSLKNVVAIFNELDVNIQEVLSPPFAASFLCLTEDEKEDGTLLIDIGEKATIYGAFRYNSLVKLGVVPIAGWHVTSDISLGLAVPYRDAEFLKNLNGCAFKVSADEYQTIEIKQIPHRELEKHFSGEVMQLLQENSISSLTSSANSVSSPVSATSISGDVENRGLIKRADLIDIIEPRMEEILQKVQEDITREKIDGLIGKILLTGGGSQMKGVSEMAANIFHKRTSAVVPAKYFEIEKIKNNKTHLNFIYANALGAVEYAFIRSSNKSDRVSDSKNFNGFGGFAWQHWQRLKKFLKI